MDGSLDLLLVRYLLLFFFRETGYGRLLAYRGTANQSLQSLRWTGTIIFLRAYDDCDIRFKRYLKYLETIVSRNTFGDIPLYYLETYWLTIRWLEDKLS